jgi:plastocyanin
VPSVTAYNGPGIYGVHYWEPMSVSVEAGGTVDISNDTTTYHGVRWLEGPETPACTSGVIVGTSETQSGTNWSGSCTFTKPGVYTFDCTVHGPAMKGTITVGPHGVSTTSTSTPTQTQPPPAPGTETSPPPREEHTTSPGSLLSSPPAQAVELAPAQRGAMLHGTLALGSGAQGASLAVAVLAGRAALGRHRGPARVRVAHLLRRSLSGANVSFSLPLDALARHALHVRSRLALTVEIVLTPPNGQALTLTRRLTLHR